MKRYLPLLALCCCFLERSEAQLPLESTAANFSSDEKTALSHAVSGVKLQVPCHIVFVGDSLTSFYPTLNYVAIVRDELTQKLGPQVLVTNAGVGGDTIVKVNARLEKDVLSLKPKPTEVFLFLGHNDSKTSSASGYTKHFVPPETFDQVYRSVIRKIKDRTGAKVTLISTAATYYEITKATSDSQNRMGRPNNLFGQPEALVQYNAMARRAAVDLGADYLDIYSPMKDLPNRRAFFTGDGLHVNQHGNRFIAVKILEYFASSP